MNLKDCPMTDSTQALTHFAATLSFETIPTSVVRRTEDLFLDWFASALAGKDSRPVESIARFAESMGPADGPSEILIHRWQQPPWPRP
jgi:2-methylcitrate dehydratase PrpD